MSSQVVLSEAHNAEQLVLELQLPEQEVDEPAFQLCADCVDQLDQAQLEALIVPPPDPDFLRRSEELLRAALAVPVPWKSPFNPSTVEDTDDS